MLNSDQRNVDRSINRLRKRVFNFFKVMRQTFVDRQKVTDSMASPVQVVVTNVP